jgi:hypothetical protein
LTAFHRKGRDAFLNALAPFDSSSSNTGHGLFVHLQGDSPFYTSQFVKNPVCPSCPALAHLFISP